jgi:DNA-binding transcriptional LysR family regulator
MELRHLRYFTAIVEAGGISRAAAHLRMTQPALGRQVRDLEHELGVRLFDRVGRRVQLTGEGEDLLRRCRVLLADAESLLERGRALASGTTGVLRVGSTPHTLEAVLTPFVARFRRSYPGVDVHFTEDGGPRLLDRLERGQVHLAITAFGDERFASRALFPAVATAVMPATHPLAKRKTVSVTDLAELPLLLLHRDFGTRQWFDAACQADRLRPRVLLESAAPQTLVALAGIGYGIAIVPSNMVLRRGVRASPVMHRGVVLGGWLGASWHPRRFLPPFGEAFVDALARFAQRSYPGRDVVRRAPPLTSPGR